MENIFNVKYNTKLDRLQIEEIKRSSRIFEMIRKHKIITIILASFISLSAINFYLIFSFIKVLENI